MALPLLAVIVLCAIWSGYWLFAERLARQQFNLERTRLAAAGSTLACAGEAWGGYPFRFEFACSKPHLDAQGQLQASAAAIRAVAQAYDPRRVILLIDGPTTLALPQQDPVVIEHARAVASVNLQSPQEPVAILDIPQLRIDTRLAAADSLMSLRVRPGGQLDLAANVKSLTARLPGLAPVQVDIAELDSTLASDQTLTVNAARASLGDLTVTAKGSLALDDNHRPQGEIEAATNDPEALLDIASRYTAITPQQRQTILSLLAMTGQKAVFTAKDGQLLLGPMRLAGLPPLY